MMKLFSVTGAAFLAATLTPTALADHHEGMQFGPVELMACTFKEDKDWDDLREVAGKFSKWAKKHDKDYSFWTISPRFREDSEMDFAWIGGWSSGAAMGAGWDAWIEDDDDLGEMFEETMDCDSSLAAVTDIYVPTDDWAEEERGVLWFSRCHVAEGKVLSDAVAAHRIVDSAMSEMGAPGNSWAFVPALGFGDVEFDYYHVQSWADYATLGTGFDAFFNSGGWKVDADAMAGTASCESPNLYDFRLQRSGER